MPQSLVFMPRQTESRGLCREVTCVWLSRPCKHFCFATGLPSPRLTSETLAPSPPVPKDCKQWFHSLQHTTMLHCTLPLHPEYMSNHSLYLPPQTMVSFNTPCARFRNRIVLRYSHPFHSHFCSVPFPDTQSQQHSCLWECAAGQTMQLPCCKTAFSFENFLSQYCL